MGAYTLIGESILNQHASKYVQMACFYTPSTLRLRFFENTSDAFERCLNEEYQMKHYLLYDSPGQLCLNVDLELSPISQINLGYKEISLTLFWTNQIHRSCFVFLIPTKDDLTKNFLHQLALHIHVYQPTIVESALHTRLCFNTLHVMFINAIDFFVYIRIIDLDF
jgi:hypothetical protein